MVCDWRWSDNQWAKLLSIYGAENHENWHTNAVHIDRENIESIVGEIVAKHDRQTLESTRGRTVCASKHDY